MGVSSSSTMMAAAFKLCVSEWRSECMIEAAFKLWKYSA
jgi:hypothetical protein